MKVTSTILDKYYSGIANPEEQEAVKLWLQSGELDAPLSINPPSDEVKREMWSNIMDTTAYSRHRRQIVMFFCSAAASLGIVFLLITFVKDNPDKAAPDRPSLAQLSIRAMSNHKDSYKIGHKGELSFCEDMEIINKGSEDHQVLFKMTCSPAHPIQKSYLIKKGQAYVAFVFTHKSKEILVINKEELRRETQPLPLRLTQKLNNEFKI